MKAIPILILLGAALPDLRGAENVAPAPSSATAEQALFARTGDDPTYGSIKDAIAKKSKAGVKGSDIRVNAKLVEVLPEAKRPISAAIKLHTLLNSAIPRASFPSWSRWYQEDGNTQVFRLFKGEENMHNARPLAARVETFSQTQWKETDEAWHEWSGVVTAIKPVGSIFQVKSSIEGPAVMILMGATGDVTLNHRRGKDQVIAKNMIGKPFLLRVRDNGLKYEVFLNGAKAGEGSYSRPKGTSTFRWGMYVGAHEVREDAMIFVSGATVDGNK